MFCFFWGGEAMKSILKNLSKKSPSAQRKIPGNSYRIPDMVWMTDVKKASELGALLPKKGPPKKVPSF
jgi:hypothetical protein